MAGWRLDEFFRDEGYSVIPSNLPEFTVYFRVENNCVNVFHVIHYRQNLQISKDQYLHIKNKIRELFTEKGLHNIHILSLVIGSDMDKAKQLCVNDSMCWILDSHENRLVVYENQISDFYGMKGRLEYFLAHWQEPGEGAVESSASGTGSRRYRLPVVTVSLVALNVFIYALCTWTGDLLYNKGAISLWNFLGEGEYYLALTSMFLHWDINHLFHNMLVLYCIGEVVENHIGPLWYGILYFVTGICGNLLFIVYEAYTGYAATGMWLAEGSGVFSAGASGAVFGVIGALFVLVIVHKGHIKQISLGRLALMIVFSLYSGLAAGNVNNAAHIGGFLSGSAAALVYWLVHGGKSREAVQNVP